MGIDQLIEVEVHGNVGVRQDDVALLLRLEPVQDAVQCVHTTGVQLDAALGKGRDDIQAAALTGQVPLTACAR